MKVLFLDIDGVCNSYSTNQRIQGFLGIDPVLADRVKEIVKATACFVVLSSSWRHQAYLRQEVAQQVVYFGDMTISLPDKPRGEEVKEWLDRHQEFKSVAILDDNSDFLEGQPLFQTSMDTGITEEIKEAVIAHLNKEEDVDPS